MESQPQNPEFRINPENFHPWEHLISHLSSDVISLLIWIHQVDEIVGILIWTFTLFKFEIIMCMDR